MITSGSGAWRCINCRHVTVSPNQSPEDMPTSGQRDEIYCAGRCQGMAVFQFEPGLQPPAQGQPWMPQGQVVSGQPLQGAPMVSGMPMQGAPVPVVAAAAPVTPLGGMPPSQPQLQPQQAQPVSAGPVPTPTYDSAQSRTSASSTSGWRVPNASELEGMTLDQLSEAEAALKAAIEAIGKEKQERQLCQICFVKPKTCIFYPCKHKVVCEECAPKLKECPVCRAAIQDFILPFEA